MDEEDFITRKRNSNPILLAPKRPPKKTDDNVEDLPSLFSSFDKNDDSFGLSSLDVPSLAEVLCPLCNKNISHLSAVRRSLHTNQCLDGQQTKNNFEKAKEKHSLTIDCPICRKPLEPGPFRSAHIKKCSKEHQIDGKKVLTLVDVQSKAIEVKKKKGLNHTSAPLPVVKNVKAVKLENQPKNKLEEDIQLAKALSESMDCVPTTSFNNDPKLIFEKKSPAFERIHNPNEPKRKRPRSYSIVQLAPHDCQCDVISTIHTRFLSMFRKKKNKTFKEEIKETTKKTDFYALQQRKLLDKLVHLTCLSKDLYSLCNSQNSDQDFEICCKDGIVKCHRLIVERRSKGLVGKGATVALDEDTQTVQYYLNYLYSGAVEWSVENNDALRRLGSKYGPESIALACDSFESSKDYEEAERSFNRLMANSVENPDIVVETIESPIISASENLTEPEYSNNYDKDCYDANKTLTDEDNCELLTKVNPVDEIDCLEEMNPIENNSNSNEDCEDPLQGINMNNTTVDISENEITIMHESAKRSPALRLESNQDIRIEKSPDLFDGDIIEINSSPQELSPTKEDSGRSQNSQASYFEANYDVPFDDGGDLYYHDNYCYSDRSPLADLPQTDDPIKGPACSVPIHPPSQLNNVSSCGQRAPAILLEDVPSEIDSFDNPIPQKPDCIDDVVDSFDNPSNYPVMSPSTNLELPLAQSTPLQPAAKRLKFGSNVKILKTSEITPMPDYEGMNDNELKEELTRIGLRPMGRKRAVQMLREIYETIHPVIDPSTPTVRPLHRQREQLQVHQAAGKKGRTVVERPNPPKRHVLFEENETTPTKATSPEKIPVSPTTSDDGLGNQTLNEPQDEPIEESFIDTALPKDMDGMTTSLLNWLRKPENDEVYNHILSLQPVMLDEFYVRLSRADDPASIIPKRILGSIMDSLGITFSLPQPVGGRRMGGGALRRKK